MDTVDNSNRSIRQGRYQPRPGSIRDPRRTSRQSVDGFLGVTRPCPADDTTVADRPRPDAAHEPVALAMQDITPQPTPATVANTPVQRRQPEQPTPETRPTAPAVPATQPDAPKHVTPVPALQAKRPVNRSAVLRRTTVQKPYLSKAQRTTLLEIRDRSLKMMATVTMVLGLGFALHTFWPIESSSNNQVLSDVTDQPRILLDQSDEVVKASETPVSQADIAAHSVAANEPKIIRIPSIDIEARVKTVKNNEASQIKMPDNIYDLGWYDGSRMPGEAGAILLNGHVSGQTERGALHYLRTIKDGEKIELERGDGQVFTYVVKEKRTIPYGQVERADVLSPITPGARGLNIVAYDARFNVTANRFQHRLIVYAEQL